MFDNKMLEIEMFKWLLNNKWTSQNKLLQYIIKNNNINEFDIDNPANEFYIGYFLFCWHKLKMNKYLIKCATIGTIEFIKLNNNSLKMQELLKTVNNYNNEPEFMPSDFIKLKVNLKDQIYHMIHNQDLYKYADSDLIKKFILNISNKECSTMDDILTTSKSCLSQSIINKFVRIYKNQL